MKVANPNPEWKKRRKAAYRNSELPSYFAHRIRLNFINKKCPICETVMNTARSMPSIQHNIPIAKGGKHELDNISVICKHCNITIQDKITGKLNNEEVKKVWEKVK